jgi:hypothetical protein
MAGTLPVVIVIGQAGVPVDPVLKEMKFSLNGSIGLWRFQKTFPAFMAVKQGVFAII